jgi:hypothetical protein
MTSANSEDYSIRPGYYRDYDTWLYLSSMGKLYYVLGPDTSEPAWRDVGPQPGDHADLGLDDAVLKTPSCGKLALLERTRMAYGIPE